MAGFKRALLLTAFAGAALAAKKKAVEVEDIETEDGVLVLTADNFDAAIKAYDPLLVEFYAPWCGHCKKLAPEYARAAKALAADGIKLAKVDASEEKSLGEKYEIQGFPTLKWFKGGKATEYGGGREEATIVSWIRKRLGAAAPTLATPAEAAAWAAKADSAVIAFVSSPTSELAKAVTEAAGANDDLPFAIATSDDVRAAYGVAPGAEAVVSVNKFEGEPNTVTYAGEAEAAAINTWAAGHAMPSVVTFSQESAPKIFRGTVKTHFLLFADDVSPLSKETLDAFRASASANRGTALYVRVPPTEERVVQYFGVTEADMPTAVLVTMPEGGAMKKFGWKKGAELTTENFNDFVASWKAGSLKPTLKSDPVPAPEVTAKEAVKTIVGESFADVVLAADKDVLLEIYAPWCGHCKQLAPAFEALGKAVGAASDKVIIAKMDGTSNEVDYPGVNVKGFPTILFFPASKPGFTGDKVPVEYDGARDLPGFIEYLQKTATHADELATVSAAAAGAEEEDDESESEL